MYTEAKTRQKVRSNIQVYSPIATGMLKHMHAPHRCALKISVFFLRCVCDCLHVACMRAMCVEEPTETRREHWIHPLEPELQM